MFLAVLGPSSLYLLFWEDLAVSVAPLRSFSPRMGFFVAHLRSSSPCSDNIPKRFVLVVSIWSESKENINSAQNARIVRQGKVNRPFSEK